MRDLTFLKFLSIKEAFNFKKIRFVLLAVAIITYTYYRASIYFPYKPVPFYELVVILTMAIFSSVYFQLMQGGGGNFKNYFYSSIIPMYASSGSFLVFYFYPNIGSALKILGGLVMVVILYSVYLTNNVIIVVGKKNTQIPLYRAALTWLQLILIVCSIPFFAGLFKIPVYSFVHAIICGITGYLFTIYFIWGQSFDNDLKHFKRGEYWVLRVMGAFMLFVASLTLSFVHTEGFLRGLFVTSVLTAVLGYIQMAMKNSLSGKTLVQYGIFIVILLFASIALLN